MADDIEAQAATQDQSTEPPQNMQVEDTTSDAASSVTAPSKAQETASVAPQDSVAPEMVPVREASTVPEFEKDPRKSRYSLRKAPDDLGPSVEVALAQRKKSRAAGLKESDDSLLKVDLLPSGDMGARVDIAGYGAAPRVVEVFPEEDLDDVIDAEEIEQIELNIETEAQQAVLNFDLSSEYQRPRLDRALAYRKLHTPTRPDGSLFPYWSTRTGRFVPKALSGIDCFREGRKSDFISFGPGVSGYFKFLKALATLFFFLCLLCLPFLFVNVNGGTHFSRHPFPFAQTTLGNLYVQFNSTQFLLSNTSTIEALNETIQSQEYVTYTLRLPTFCSGNPDGCVFKRTDLILAYSIWDAAISLIAVFAINVIMYFTRHETVIYKQKIPKIEDYSIETTVPEDADAKSLQIHFETLLQHISEQVQAHSPFYHDFTKVYDVQIVESTGNAISLCIRRGFMLKRLARLDAKIKSFRQRGIPESRIHPIVKKFEKTREQITKLDEKAMQRAEKGRALMAFVTFETQEAKARVLHAYDVFWLCGRQPEKLKFQARDMMKIRPAPPPSTLLWENQEISVCNRMIRLAFSFLLFAGILGITAGLSFITDSNRAFSEVLDVVSGETYVLCDGRYDSATSLADAAEQARANNDVTCFCDYEMLAPKPEGAEDNGFLFVPGGFCADYAFQKATSIGKEIGLSFVILVINLIIFKVVLVTAHFMKFKNVVDREFAVLRAIFLITLINTAVICLLVNTDFERLTGSTVNDISVDGTVLIRVGQFVDFEPGWYSRVGVELFLIGVLNIFGPHVLPMLRYFYHVMERRYFAPYAVSQQVLNEMYIGEEFLLSVRLAQTLMMVFFVLMFSSGMPIMYFVGLTSLIIAYWFDKFLFVRLVRTPPQFDTALQQWTVRTMEWAVVVHCLVGFWMYSSPRMFPLTDAEAQDSLLNELSTSLQITAAEASNVTRSGITFVNEMSARFARIESVIMLACAGLIVLIKLLRRFGKTLGKCSGPAHACMNMVRACSGREHQLRHLNKYVAGADNFDIALQKGRVAGVRSYNILANPVYQRVFQMQDGLGEEYDHKSRAGSSATDKKVDAETGSFRGFQSLQDALNIRKGTAVSSIEARSIWKDDGKSSVNSSASKQTTALYTKKTDAPAGDHRSVASVKSVDARTKSTKSIKADAKSVKEQSPADDDVDPHHSVKSVKSIKSVKSVKSVKFASAPPAEQTTEPADGPTNEAESAVVVPAEPSANESAE